MLSFSHWEQTDKEEIKLSFFVDNMIIYIENPKESTKQKQKRKNTETKKTLLELIFKFSKVTEYKLICKSQLHEWQNCRDGKQISGCQELGRRVQREAVLASKRYDKGSS